MHWRLLQGRWQVLKWYVLFMAIFVLVLWLYDFHQPAVPDGPPGPGAVVIGSSFKECGPGGKRWARVQENGPGGRIFYTCTDLAPGQKFK